MVIFLLFAFLVPIAYLLRVWNTPVTNARSPITTMLFLTMLMLDSILNTIIFHTQDDSLGHAKLKCFMGLWVTMGLMVPILASIYIRIYRVKRVFELYEQFMKVYVRSASLFSYETPTYDLQYMNELGVSHNKLDKSVNKEFDKERNSSLMLITKSSVLIRDTNSKKVSMDR